MQHSPSPGPLLDCRAPIICTDFPTVSSAPQVEQIYQNHSGAVFPSFQQQPPPLQGIVFDSDPPAALLVGSRLIAYERPTLLAHIPVPKTARERD